MVLFTVIYEASIIVYFVGIVQTYYIPWIGLKKIISNHNYDLSSHVVKVNKRRTYFYMTQVGIQ